MHVTYRRAILAAIVALAALHAASFRGYGPCDDDYITYRYARNLVEGLGPVYNAGERVEGFSAPGWMLAVAGALALGVEAPVFSVVVSIAAMAGAAWSIGRVWARRHAADPSFAPALLVAASPVIAWHAIVGLGSVLVAALLALWIDLWDRAERAGRVPWGAAMALGLAALVRNEAILFALPFAFVELRRRHIAAATAAFVPLAAWEAFRLSYYGRLVPITYEVKKLAFADDLRLGLEYLGTSSATTGIVVALALSLFVIARRDARPPRSWSAAAIGLIVFAAYVVYVGGDFLPLARFFVPVLPLALLVACEGALVLAQGARAPSVATLVLALGFEQVPQAQRAELKGIYETSEQRWEKLGREVGARVPPDTKVGLAPIGAFGFESRLYVVDFLGLTNNAIASAAADLSIRPKGHQRYDAEWVLAQQPEMLIIGNGWLQPDREGVPTLVANPWERTLVAHPRFHAEYVPLQIEIGGSYPLIFYWRRDVPRPRGASGF